MTGPASHMAEYTLLCVPETEMSEDVLRDKKHLSERSSPQHCAAMLVNHSPVYHMLRANIMSYRSEVKQAILTYVQHRVGDGACAVCDLPISHPLFTRQGVLYRNRTTMSTMTEKAPKSPFVGSQTLLRDALARISSLLKRIFKSTNHGVSKMATGEVEVTSDRMLSHHLCDECIVRVHSYPISTVDNYMVFCHLRHLSLSDLGKFGAHESGQDPRNKLGNIGRRALMPNRSGDAGESLTLSSPIQLKLREALVYFPNNGDLCQLAQAIEKKKAATEYRRLLKRQVAYKINVITEQITVNTQNYYRAMAFFRYDDAENFRAIQDSLFEQLEMLGMKLGKFS